MSVKYGCGGGANDACSFDVSGCGMDVFNGHYTFDGELTGEFTKLGASKGVYRKDGKEGSLTHLRWSSWPIIYFYDGIWKMEYDDDQYRVSAPQPNLWQRVSGSASDAETPPENGWYPHPKNSGTRIDNGAVPTISNKA